MLNLRNRIVSLGRNKTVLFITITTTLISVVISFTASGSQIDLIFAAVAAVIIIPAVSWYVVGLLVRIQQLEEHINILATYDTLTGAMTRRAFLETYENTYHYTQRNKLPLALISIEPDEFKKINNADQHEINDEILISLSNIIETQKRKSDIFTRMGWGKFVLLLPDTAVEDAITLANKLRCLTKETIVTCHQKDIQYTVSMGVSGIEPSNQINLEQLIKQADDALSQARHQGADCVIEFTKESEYRLCS